MSAEEPTVFDTFTYTGRCGHVCQVVNGREQPHECRPRPPRDRISASVLREAAALMRERAEAATPGGPRWETEPDEAMTNRSYIFPAYSDSAIASAHVDDATHIASWHPAVALAVADLLENEASLIEGTERHPDLHLPPNGARIDLLLALATAYLNP